MNTAITVVPLAIAMMAGPQMLSAVLLATSATPVPNSVAFVAAVAIATSFGVTVGYVFVSAFRAGGPGGSAEEVVRWGVILLLVAASVWTFLRRHDQSMPRWMSSLQTAGPSLSFRIGLLLILLMPTDLVVMLSAAEFLALNGLGIIAAWPFILATVLLAALPLLTYVVLGERARIALPGVRDRMSQYSWLISICVYVFFIWALLG